MIKEYKDIRKEFIWTTREGVEWILKDMKEDHIKKCIKHLNRMIERMPSNKIGRDIWFYDIKVFENELKYRRKYKLIKILSKNK